MATVTQQSTDLLRPRFMSVKIFHPLPVAAGEIPDYFNTRGEWQLQKEVTDPFNITAQFTRTPFPIDDTANIALTNLSRDFRSQLLGQVNEYRANRAQISGMTSGTEQPAETMPYMPITVEAGRRNAKTKAIEDRELLFIGGITGTDLGQPPDIDLILRASNGANMKLPVPRSWRLPPGSYMFEEVCQHVADLMGMGLDFSIEDFVVRNPNLAMDTRRSLPGALMAMIKGRETQTVYIDMGRIVVRDQRQPFEAIVPVNKTTGMVGIPSYSKFGVKVRALWQPRLKPGVTINLTSEQNPSVNGLWVIMKLDYDLATRSGPFYVQMDCAPPIAGPKAVGVS